MPKVRFKRKLSPLTVTKLRPQAKTYTIWDELQRGLCLRIQPTGHRSFALVYRHRGRPRWYTIGPADAISLSDARKVAAEKMADVLVRGKDPCGERAAGRQSITFGTLADRYITEHAKVRNKSWKQTDFLLRKYVLPLWNDLAADS